ncbi:Lacal_2735 family protein [Flavivirga abyssicola]|uniref:Lacal_2735 family protein n=1 Tax=Flavivirga rizhaonensis TaxID=2559571 RepID=A0A4S1DRN5_9FLAO|nr:MULTISPECIES: Lacal_2735 family protein [Flavivirga]TGV00571.1 Lacal_2735 family protein [Flavivirga rizhaonensis]WVK14061.1 Lacal_2735 family protein [Flavivirga sp. MEBiC07777]
MFNFFKRKSPLQKLNDTHRKLLKEAHKLSTVNRKMSDEKYVEADKIFKKIEKLVSELN